MRSRDLPVESQPNPELHFAIYLEDIRVSLNGFKLEVDSYGILPNRIEVVIGPNGAGKTTLCDIITGKTRINRGEVYLRGAGISRKFENDIALMGVGRKFQTPNVFSQELTVLQNMELALPGRFSIRKNFDKFTSNRELASIEDTLSRLSLQGETAKMAGSLSHGQRQRLELAMLVLSESYVLIVDEPAAGLDENERGHLSQLLCDLSKDHTILVIEHDLNFVRSLRADVTVMSEGKDIAFGTFDYVWSQPQVEAIYKPSVEDSLTASRRLRGITEPRVEAISASGLSVYHGDARTLDNININVQAASITCVLGLNGAGKSTLMRTLMGIQVPSAGIVRLFGRSFNEFSTPRRVREGLALIPQGRGIHPKSTLEENLLLGCEANPKANPSIPPELYRVFEWMQRDLKKLAGDLSGGQQQQLAIARALLGRPRALLMDEPTDGIDPPTIQDLIELIRSLVDGKCPLLPRGEKLSILLVEQNLSFVQALADYFYILERGKIIMQGPIHELTRSVIDQFLGD